MMKKWLSLILAAIMLLALAPAALASSEDFVKNGGDADADIYGAIGDETPVGKLAVGAQKKLLGTETSGGETWYKIEGGYVKKANGVEKVTVLTAELSASGASVKYGETAKVTASVKDGEGYKIEFSVDGGEWTETVPTRTEPGKSTVKVRATKDGADTLTDEVTLEVGEKPAEAKLVASGASVKYGETAKVTAKVENGEGYKIEYSTDGTTWAETAPTRTEPGKITVKVRATKDGADTLTDEVTLEVGNKPSSTTTTLTATGGTFPYDGKAHAVTYTLENGDGYTVRFSTDDGKTWTTKAPSLTKVGKLTVKVEASKSGAETLTVQVKLEVTNAAADGSTVTIVNCDSWVNVRAKASSSSAKLGTAKKGKVFKLLGVEGKWYKIQYTSDKVGYVFHSYVKVGSGTAPTPDPTPVSGDTGTIHNCTSWVNVREKASSSSKKLGTAKKGEVFKVLGISGHWVKVEYKGDPAYIYDRYVKLSNGGTAPAPDPTPVSGDKGYIVNCKTCVNVRQKASSSSKKLGTLNKGTEITITGTSGKWTKIAYKGGTAYVFSEYVSTKKPDDDVVGKTATIYNCNSWVNVREKASSSSKKLGEAKKGATYTVKGVSGNWVKVDYDGKTAYIYKRYVKIG